MRTNNGSAKPLILVAFGAALCVTALVFAQQTSVERSVSTSSQSQNGTATASGSARATATASGGTARSVNGVTSIGLPVDGRPTYAAWYTFAMKQVVAPEQTMQEHDNFIRALAKNGNLVLEGPFQDGTGALLIFKASNDEEARHLIGTDATVQSGRLLVELKRWNVRMNANMTSGATSGKVVGGPAVPTERAGVAAGGG